jgi:glycosyltransferase involved in cell wall biosynthesis
MGLRIGIDTLFLDGRNRSSLANFVIAFVDAVVQLATPHQLILFASPSTAKFFPPLPRESVEVIACPVSNERRLARILFQQLRLPRLIASRHVDVLCCLADVAPLRTNVPVVLKVNSLHHFTAPDSLGFARRSYRHLMIGASARRARYVIANSRSTAADVEALLGVESQRIRLVYEAVDDSFGPCVDQSRVKRALRERHGISGEYLLFVSALYSYKNLDQLIRAFKVLIDDGGWTGELIVVGSDPHGRKVHSERLAADLGITPLVRFLGDIDNVNLPDLYCGASVFVYPSASETFGKPIVEAMRCGSPIVAADRGSIPDIAAGAALLVDPDDTQSVARAIQRLLSDQELRIRLRDIGLKRGQDFSWRRVALGFIEALEAAVA